MSSLFESWGSTTGIDTIEALRDQMDRNSTMAIKNHNIPNEALDNLQRNPRDPVPKCVIDGIISYGVSRMKSEAAQEKQSQAERDRLQAEEGKKAAKKAAEPEKSTVARLKDERMKKSDTTNTSGMILPILLLGCALFLIMK